MLTWRNLYRLLDAAGLAATECFFTNAYVGLKAGQDPTGGFPGAGDAEFRNWCQRFLAEQITQMQPRAIATLGSNARRFMATMASELAGWSRSRSPVAGVVSATFAGRRTRVIPLLHPSGYHASLKRRVYRDEVGLAAEAALLRDGVGAEAASDR